MGIRFEKRVVNIIEGVINSTLFVNQKKLIIKKRHHNFHRIGKRYQFGDDIILKNFCRVGRWCPCA